MGKSTISMAIFNSYVKLPEGTMLYVWYVYIDWLVVTGTFGTFFHILGMSSSQLTNSYFFRGIEFHQPVEFCRLWLIEVYGETWFLGGFLSKCWTRPTSWSKKSSGDPGETRWPSSRNEGCFWLFIWPGNCLWLCWSLQYWLTTVASHKFYIIQVGMIRHKWFLLICSIFP